MDNGSACYRRFLAGDEGALLELVSQYRPGLRMYLYGIVHDFDLADDLTQDTFVKLCFKRPKDQGGATFKTWLYTIGRNLALDHLRKNKAYRAVSLDECFDLADPLPTPETALLAREQNEALVCVLQRLQPSYRQVLYLTYHEGFDTAQLAKILKKSRHNVSALLYRAKQALKAALEQEDFTYEI